MVERYFTLFVPRKLYTFRYQHVLLSVSANKDKEQNN